MDAHPEPYRDSYYVALGYTNEGANVNSRSLMRDAPFSLYDSVLAFTMKAPDWVYGDTLFEGRPAVSLFNDSLGYYPGAGYVLRGPEIIRRNTSGIRFSGMPALPSRRRFLTGSTHPDTQGRPRSGFTAVELRRAHYHATGTALGSGMMEAQATPVMREASTGGMSRS